MEDFTATEIPDNPGRTNRIVVVVGICLVAASVSLHTRVAGWGTLCPSQTSAWTPIGIVYLPSDNLSYCMWAQQAKRGDWLFRDLYTTTPHRPLLFNPLFYVVGRLAAVFQTTPMLIFNLVALACIPWFLGSLSRIYKALGFRESTTFLLFCLVLGGGGVSWIRSLLLTTRLHEMLHTGDAGPDLFYYDFYPGLSFCSFPYHAIALTMLAVLAAMIVAYENPERPLGVKQWLLLTLVSALFASSRPYEPVALFGSYFLLTLVSHLAETPREIRRRRRRILSSLMVGMLPFGVYSLWAATQPVWKELAQCSLNLYGNADWVGSLLILWVLAAVGIFIGCAGCLTSPRALFFSWSIFCAVLLVVLAAGPTKVAGGVTIPLSVAAGVAIEQIFAAKPWGWKLKLACVVLAFCAVASPLLSLYRHSRKQSGMPTDLVHALAAIQADSNASPPTVLTGRNWGPVLSSLFGFRVFCGHWSLTDSSEDKVALLAMLGFRGRKIPIPSTTDLAAVRRQAGILLVQLNDDVFDYLVLSNNQILSQELVFDAAEHAVYEGTEFRAFRISPGIRNQLAERLRAIATPDRETSSGISTR